MLITDLKAVLFSEASGSRNTPSDTVMAACASLFMQKKKKKESHKFRTFYYYKTLLLKSHQTLRKAFSK